MGRRRILRRRSRNKGREYVYLGKKVPDRGKKGIDRPSEVIGITNAILRDYRNHKISKTTFNRRLALLGLATVKDKDLNKKQKGKLLAVINFVRVFYGLSPLKFRKGSYDENEYNKQMKILKEKLNKIVNEKMRQAKV